LTAGVRFPAGERYISLFCDVQTDSGAHPAYYPMGTACYFPELKRPKREAGHSPPRRRNSSPGRGKIFLFFMSSRPVVGPTQPPIQWVPGAPSPSVKPTTHLQLVKRSRTRGCIHHSPIRLHGVVLNLLSIEII
jgi:hypothetical protein